MIDQTSFAIGFLVGIFICLSWLPLLFDDLFDKIKQLIKLEKKETKKKKEKK